jgi:cytochrome c oxidase subunit 4
MAEAHDHVTGSYGEVHAGPTFNTYIGVFIALAIFTLMSFLVNLIFGQGNHSGMAIIMLVAVCKAVLVGMFFMHLKFDWSRLYFLVFPLLILATMMIIVLLPDFVVGWHMHPESLIPPPASGPPPLPHH